MSKIDYNYIAAVEKSVSEKYGKEAVQDFRSLWHEEKEKQYLQQLKSKRKRDNNRRKIKHNIVSDDVVIRKRRHKKRNNRTCPVCKTYSFSVGDDLYMNRFDCCQRCYIEYVEFREERWLVDGWRPSHGEYKQPRLRSFIKAVKQYVGKFLRRIKKWLPF
mgnify:FL=1